MVVIYNPKEKWFFLRKGKLTSQPFYSVKALLKAYRKKLIDWTE